MRDLSNACNGFGEILRPDGAPAVLAEGDTAVSWPFPFSWLAGSPLDPSEWVSVIALTGIVVALVVWVVPTWNLLRKSLPQRGRGNVSWHALVTLVQLSMRGVQARSLHKAARLRIEIELIDPAPEPPLRLHHRQKAEYRTAVKDWRHDKGKWKERVNILLAELAQEVQEEDAGPAIPVPTCSPLIDNDGIERYFNALHHQLLRPAQQPVFLSKVMIKSGFAAPLHLLTGVLARYHEDWPTIVEGYGRSIIRPGDVLRYHPARNIQMFIFDCWLLWGPSIPLCSCPEWHGDVALQYGYGDEDNSLTLRCKSPDVLREVTGLSAGVAGFAIQTRVSGTLKWGPVLRDFGICPAQAAIWKDKRLVLDITDEKMEGMRAAGGTEEQVFAQYYSAYLWIAFVMCDKDGEPLNPNGPADVESRDHRWRDIIPFFMHGNIGDNATYEFHTSQLARAVLEGARQLLVAEKESGLILRFVCAIDESGCGFDIRYKMPANHTIREKVRRFADATTDADDRAVLQRLDLEYDMEAPFKDGDYSACALPGIVEGHYHEVNDDLPTFRELRATRETDIKLLERFYRDCFKPELPNPDARESCETIVNYLRLKETGWYGKNNYHVVLAFDKGEPVGGAIADYLYEPNAGVIEYLVVQPEHRGKSIGRGLLEHTERLLHDDADNSGGRQLDWIVAELDDPYATPRRSNGFNPNTRLRVWGKWKYRMLSFPYLQPALSPDKKPVTTLMLTAKICSTRFDSPHDYGGSTARCGDQTAYPADYEQRASAVPRCDLEILLREYMRWAMRIEHPENVPEFEAMTHLLPKDGGVSLVGLDDYLGSAKGICVKEVTGQHDPQFDRAISLYTDVSKCDDTAIAPGRFREAVQSKVQARQKDPYYHLWTFSTAADDAVAIYECVASFMTTKSGGFCGYLGLADSALDTVRLRRICARIEERMMRDIVARMDAEREARHLRARIAERVLNVVPWVKQRRMRDALPACGWTIACHKSQHDIYSSLGFQRADERQRAAFEQTRVPGTPDGSVDLLHKTFGRTY